MEWGKWGSEGADNIVFLEIYIILYVFKHTEKIFMQLYEKWRLITNKY